MKVRMLVSLVGADDADCLRPGVEYDVPDAFGVALCCEPAGEPRAEPVGDVAWAAVKAAADAGSSAVAPAAENAALGKVARRTRKGA